MNNLNSSDSACEACLTLTPVIVYQCEAHIRNGHGGRCTVDLLCEAVSNAPACWKVNRAGLVAGNAT